MPRPNAFKYEPRHKSNLPFGRFGFRQYSYYTIAAAAKNKGSDQTARMHRLICNVVVLIWHQTGFHMTWFI